MKPVIRELLITLLLAVLIFLGLRAVIDSREIPSSSMEPTLQIGQRLIVEKVTYHFHDPEMGDIIVFHPPNQPRDATPFIKRIIGLPGDRVEVKDDGVYVNGQKLDEPYIKEPAAYTMPEVTVPDNEYFVLGDNRNVSADSHIGYTVPRDNIIGRAWLSIWPPSQWGLIDNYSFEGQMVSSTRGDDG